MKTSLKFLVLFGFIFTKQVYGMDAEYVDDSSASPTTTSYDSYGSSGLDASPTVRPLAKSCPNFESLADDATSYPMEYYIFTDGDNKCRVRIQRRVFVPVYNYGEDGPLEYRIVDEIIGEWDMNYNKEFLAATFEFYEYNHQCRFK